MVKYSKKYSTYQRQLDHILDTYQFDSSIEQFILGGNHDKKYNGTLGDIIEILEKESNGSIHSVGYIQAYFKIYNQIISLEHNSHMRQNRVAVKDFTIAGHSHVGKFEENRVKLPTCSDCVTDINQKFNPGFMTLESNKSKNHLYINLRFNQYIFSDNGPLLEDSQYYTLPVKKLVKK